MTVFDTVWPLITLTFGSVLTYLLSGAASSKAVKTQDLRDRRANDARLDAAGREHATKALEVLRDVRENFWIGLGAGGARSDGLESLFRRSSHRSHPGQTSPTTSRGLDACPKEPEYRFEL
jgi:hypothetical protein